MSGLSWLLASRVPRLALVSALVLVLCLLVGLLAAHPVFASIASD